jgi:tight adherence protein C
VGSINFAQYVGYALLIVGVFTVYMAFVSFFKKDRNLQRAQKIAGNVNYGEENQTSGFAPLMEQILMLLGVNVRQHRELANELSQAGINGQAALVYYLFFQRVVQPIIAVCGIIVLAKVLHPALRTVPVGKNPEMLILGLLLTVIGIFGSKLYLSNKAQHRRDALAKSFPEALDLMLICVESGLGIDAAFGRVCKEIKESYPVMASEFDRTRFEMSMMNDRVQALQNLADRTGYVPIRSFVSSLVQAERFGTSLVETIRLIAEEQRTDRMMQAEQRAARLPALITIPLVVCILPALVMIILGPIIIRVIAQGGIFGAHS